MQRADEGRVEGGDATIVQYIVVTIVHLQDLHLMWPAHHCSQRQLLRSVIE